MTRHPLARFVPAVLAAAVIAACGGGDTGVDETALQAGVTSAPDSDEDAPTTGEEPAGEETRSEETRSEAGGGGNAGGPDPGGGGGGGGARPGGPFDVEAFEQIGQPADEFLPVGREYCSGGRCTLVEETFESEEVSLCEVDRFEYDPPARPADASPSDQFIQRGTTVTVFIACPPEESEKTDTTETESTETESTETESTDTTETETTGTETESTETASTDGGSGGEPAG